MTQKTIFFEHLLVYIKLKFLIAESFWVKIIKLIFFIYKKKNDHIDKMTYRRNQDNDNFVKLVQKFAAPPKPIEPKYKYREKFHFFTFFHF